MPDFKLPANRILSSAFPTYQGREVVMIDALQVAVGSRVELIFERSSSVWRQGVWLGTNGILKINEIESRSFQIWADSSPHTVAIDCHATDRQLHLYNIWDRGRGRESQSWTSGMLIDKIERGYRYFCNDIGQNPRFDKLMGTIWLTYHVLHVMIIHHLKQANNVQVKARSPSSHFQ